ncbi:MAG TPA: hypothetical protein ACN46R_04150, partial [Prochlorococcus sp.]
MHRANGRGSSSQLMPISAVFITFKENCSPLLSLRSSFKQAARVVDGDRLRTVLNQVGWLPASWSVMIRVIAGPFRYGVHAQS